MPIASAGWLTVWRRYKPGRTFSARAAGSLRFPDARTRTGAPGWGQSLSGALSQSDGVTHKQRSNFVRTRAILSQALGIFRAQSDPQRTASLDNNLGAVLRALDDLESARACYEENLSIHRRLVDPRGVALVNLGNPQNTLR